jgi:hypothetical protein
MRDSLCRAKFSSSVFSISTLQWTTVKMCSNRMRSPWLIFLLFLHLLEGNQPLNIDSEYFLKLVGGGNLSPLQSLPQTDQKKIRVNRPRVLVVIPGFGCDSDRTKIVLNNLLILNHSRQSIEIDCLIFLSCEPYEHITQTLSQSCDLQIYEQGSYAQYLKAVVPIFVKQAGYTHILILLDDAQLSFNYRLDYLTALMRRYSLSVISPAVINAVYPSTSCSFCSPRLRSTLPSSLTHSVPPINQLPLSPPPAPRPIGFTTDAIEIFATLFTFRAWKCFHSLLQPTLNSAGWSYDRCFKKYCEHQSAHSPNRPPPYSSSSPPLQPLGNSSTPRVKRKAEIRLGVVDSMVVLHNSPRMKGTDADSINGIPKPAIERDNWLKELEMEPFLSPEDVFGEELYDL